MHASRAPWLVRLESFPDCTAHNRFDGSRLRVCSVRQLSISLAMLVLLGGVLYGAPADGARIPVVLSTDVGNEVDDQWAVTYLLLQPRFQVLGVMSAQAPSLTAPAGHTSYRILVDVVEHRLGMSKHPPLIEGGSVPLVNEQTPQPSQAVTFLIEISRRFSSHDRLTVLMIGAATDVASAIL